MGGTGGAPPRPDILCDHEVCETNPDRKTACELLVAYCIADEPRSSWDECFAFALGFICGADGGGGTGGSTGEVAQVFVTSEVYTGGQFGGNLNDADGECSGLAAMANPPLSGFWTAWLSTRTEDAEERIIDAQYVLVDGTVIANSKAELLDGNLDDAIVVDENGDPVSGELGVWTGTDADGTNSGVNCDNWQRDSSTGQSGLANAEDATWTNNQEEDCDLSKRLYCFGG
jgi:hypothetical protein